MRLLAATLVVLLLLVPRPDARAATDARPTPSFDLRLFDVPHAVATDGGTRLIYELHLVNFSETPLQLRRLDVVDALDGRVLASFPADALARRFAKGARCGIDVAPGLHCVLYLEWEAPRQRPREIAHVLTFAAPGAEPARVRGARAAPSYATGQPLGPPLRGGPWIAIHYAGWPNGHRRVFNAVEGKARIPGRFAIDWVRTDDAGRIARGDADVPSHALGYDAPVLAVADATVAAVRDGMAEAARVSANPRHALADEAGNYVSLRLDDGRYAFYEHLRPGSITVRPGQRVRRGQVLGALGFTGASTGPHLHFHVADGPHTVGAEGRPFVHDAFELLGRYADPASIGNGRWTPRPADEAGQRHDEWPAENAVVRFPD